MDTGCCCGRRPGRKGILSVPNTQGGWGIHGSIRLSKLDAYQELTRRGARDAALLV